MYILKYWINIENLNWDNLSRNPNAIDLLQANPDKINWDYLSENLLKNLIYYIQ